MSTDLQILHDFPKPGISSSTIDIAAPSDENDRVTTTTTTTTAAAAHQRGRDEGERDEDEDEGRCRTPTSKENRIPEILTCPPAPKKPKRVVSCKRKLLDEFQLFEMVNKDEIDGFFRSNLPKRSCRCT